MLSTVSSKWRLCATQCWNDSTFSSLDVFTMLAAPSWQLVKYNVFTSFSLPLVAEPVGPALDLEDYRPSVLLHCWLGHLTCKIVSEMTYNVSSGTLNPTIPYHTLHSQNNQLSASDYILEESIASCRLLHAKYLPTFSRCRLQCQTRCNLRRQTLPPVPPSGELDKTYMRRLWFWPIRSFMWNTKLSTNLQNRTIVIRGPQRCKVSKVYVYLYSASS